MARWESSSFWGSCYSVPKSQCWLAILMKNCPPSFTKSFWCHPWKWSNLLDPLDAEVVETMLNATLWAIFSAVAARMCKIAHAPLYFPAEHLPVPGLALGKGITIKRLNDRTRCEAIMWKVWDLQSWKPFMAAIGNRLYWRSPRKMPAQLSFVDHIRTAT